MAVKIIIDEAGSDARWTDDGRDAPTYRYRVIHGGAVQIISTPPRLVGLAGSTVEVTFGPIGYKRVEGIMFGGTDEDLV